MALSVIEALRRFLPAFLKSGPPLNQDQRRALWAIEHCRTPTMGGHLYTCQPCKKRVFAYHSCNHKACPQCGRQATAKWVERELGKRVNAPYFMVTFTLPSELRRLFFGPLAKEAYNLFFAASSKALGEKLADPKWLAASVNGFTAVLHTWNQQLLFHPHIHYLVPAAGIDAKGKVVRVKKENYLVHIPLLQQAFRDHFRRGLQKRQWGVDPAVWTKDWGLNIQPFGSGVNAIKYLGAYVCRTAIGDRRIVSIQDQDLTFQWKDRADGDRTKLQSIPGHEFVKRYLRHVLPSGMRTIRYYGFCHPAAKKNRERIRFHTGLPLEMGSSITAEKVDCKVLGIPRCPCCHKPMKRTGSFKSIWVARGPP